MIATILFTPVFTPWEFVAMTRYPKAGKGHKWTVRELAAVAPAWKGDTLSDGGGLSGEVRLTADGAVTIRFKYAFRWADKVSWYQCGTYPAVDMAEIRSRRDKARDLVAEGVNPNDEKKAARIEAQAAVEATIAEAKRQESENKTFADLFDAWITDGVARDDGNAELKRTFGRDILPVLGATPIRSITDADLREALRRVGRERGRGRTAERMLSELRQMFRWADKRQPWRGLLIEGNPAELVERKQVVPADYAPGVRDRTLSPDELRELRGIFSQTQAAYDAAADRRTADRPLQKTTQLAMWICLATCCRIGELLMARWEHVDLKAGRWFVPGPNTKTKTDWLVYLSPFALGQFKALHELTGDSPWCFPARGVDNHVCVKSASKQVGDRQMQFKARKPLKNRRHDNSLVLANGVNGEWTPHDLRRTGATMMQALGVSLDIIDRCQNHVLAGSKVRRHYLHHDYADEKTEAWAKLGAELEVILT